MSSSPSRWERFRETQLGVHFLKNNCELNGVKFSQTKGLIFLHLFLLFFKQIFRFVSLLFFFVLFCFVLICRSCVPWTNEWNVIPHLSINTLIHSNIWLRMIELLIAVVVKKAQITAALCKTSTGDCFKWACLSKRFWSSVYLWRSRAPM